MTHDDTLFSLDKIWQHPSVSFKAALAFDSGAEKLRIDTYVVKNMIHNNLNCVFRFRFLQ